MAVSASAKTAADLVRRGRCRSQGWLRPMAMEVSFTPRATRVKVSGIFGLTAGLHSGAPGGRFSGEPSDAGKAPWKPVQPSRCQQRPPVRHRGRDDGYNAAAPADDAFAVRVFFRAIRTTESTYDLNGRGCSDGVTLRLTPTRAASPRYSTAWSISNAPTAQRWKKASAAAQGTS